MGLMETVIDIPAEHEANVFGQFDAYAKKIERALHVTLIARGESVKIMGDALKVEKAKTIVGVCVICASLMFVGTVYPKMTYYLEKYDTDKATYTKLDNAMDTYVPQNASVCASGFFTPHLSKHLEMYDQNHLTEDKYTDYLVVDERNQNEAAKFTNIVNSGKYELVYREDNLISIYHLKDNK